MLNGVRVTNAISYNLVSNHVLRLRDILVGEMEACADLDGIVPTPDFLNF